MRRSQFLVTAGSSALITGCATSTDKILSLGGTRQTRSAGIVGNSAILYSNVTPGKALATATYDDFTNTFSITTPPNSYHPNGGFFNCSVSGAKHLTVGSPAINTSLSASPGLTLEPHTIAAPSTGVVSGGGGSYSYTNRANADGSSTFTDLYGSRTFGNVSRGGGCGKIVCPNAPIHPMDIACVESWLAADAVGAGMTAHIFTVLKAANFILDAVPGPDIILWSIDAAAVIVAVGVAWFICSQKPQ